jgi:hypothetical protein
MLDPKRIKLRTDNELPAATKSKMEAADPSLDTPYADNELPTRTNERTLKLEPTVQKSRIDKVDPILLKP